MFFQRCVITAARRITVTPVVRAPVARTPVVRRGISSSLVRREAQVPTGKTTVPAAASDAKSKEAQDAVRKTEEESSSSDSDADETPEMIAFKNIQTGEDLLPPGAPAGKIPTDLDQATGLERLELLGKLQGIDIFKPEPLDTSRKGTLKEPIIVKSFSVDQYVGCTGHPVNSHWVIWLAMTRERPLERCPECGNVFEMDFQGVEPEHDDHGDHHGHHEEAKTFADYVRPEYR